MNEKTAKCVRFWTILNENVRVNQNCLPPYNFDVSLLLVYVLTHLLTLNQNLKDSCHPLTGGSVPPRPPAPPTSQMAAKRKLKKPRPEIHFLIKNAACMFESLTETVTCIATLDRTAPWILSGHFPNLAYCSNRLCSLFFFDCPNQN